MLTSLASVTVVNQCRTIVWGVAHVLFASGEVTRALWVHARCDDCTEPHSFIWTGGEEPGADYNLIYWAKL